MAEILATPRADVALDAFFHRLARAPERILILDYDGTLAPFHVDPAEARPHAGVAEAIAAIRDEAATRVVLASGRLLSELDHVAASIPHDEAWGSHGWERRVGTGPAESLAPDARAARQLADAHAALRAILGDDIRIERKAASVAAHWRGLTPAQARHAREAVLETWSQLPRDALAMLPFDGGLELRVRGRSKGDVVQAVLAAASPLAACAYLGDDLTDEDAFGALSRRGLGVLVREELRPTLARAWVRSPEALLAFLERWRLAARGAR